VRALSGDHGEVRSPGRSNHVRVGFAIRLFAMFSVMKTSRDALSTHQVAAKASRGPASAGSRGAPRDRGGHSRLTKIWNVTAICALAHSAPCKTGAGSVLSLSLRRYESALGCRHHLAGLRVRRRARLWTVASQLRVVSERPGNDPCHRARGLVAQWPLVTTEQ
jgi:hypothetical protein